MISVMQVSAEGAAFNIYERTYTPYKHKYAYLSRLRVQAQSPQPGKATLTAAPASAWDGEWVLAVDQFAPGAVGQKSMSTTNLHKAAAAAAAAGRRSGSVLQLPEWLKLPASVALPHGSFEAALRAPLNRDMAAQLQDLAGRIAAAAVEDPGNPDACAAELQQIR
jgi:hypothetical protein